METHIREDPPRRFVMWSSSIVRMESRLSGGCVFVDHISEKSVFHPLGLYSATKHKVGQSRISFIDNREPHYTIISKLIITLDHVRVQMRRLQDFCKARTVVPVPRKIHLVGTLRQFMNPLEALICHRT